MVGILRGMGLAMAKLVMHIARVYSHQPAPPLGGGIILVDPSYIYCRAPYIYCRPRRSGNAFNNPPQRQCPKSV